MPSLKGLSKGQWLMIAGAAVIIILLFSFVDWCGNPNAGAVYSPREWRDILAKDGWIPLPFPDSKYRPGSIIKVTKDDIRWIDDLEACRYPTDEFEVKSYIPGITFTKQWEFSGDAIVNFKGVTAGPKFDRMSKVRMEIIDHGADAFGVLRFKVWMEKPENRETISQVCMDQLLKPDYYLITEAFRVSKAKYTLYDKTGAAIKLETPALDDLIQFEPNLKHEVTSDGSLVIEEPVCFAIKKTMRLGDDFEPRATNGDVDKIIEGLFFDLAGKPQSRIP
jgi:hypothetical protein